LRNFQLTDPDVFVDNHCDDGADYQHVMTLLTSQHNKLAANGEYFNKEFEPALYSSMNKKGYNLVPYVKLLGDTPENGWSEYWIARVQQWILHALATFCFVPKRIC